MSLTEQLGRYDFLCGIENEVYILNLTKRTILIIERKQDWSGAYIYDFYKETLYYQSSKLQFYGQGLREEELMQYVKFYFKNRSKYYFQKLVERQNKKNPRMTKVELLKSLKKKNIDENVSNENKEQLTLF